MVIFIFFLPIVIVVNVIFGDISDIFDFKLY